LYPPEVVRVPPVNDGASLTISELLALDAALVPFAFTAAIVNEYDVPLTNVADTENGDEVPE
jgi:hypothetical protein